jgi:hypothetical protein
VTLVAAVDAAGGEAAVPAPPVSVNWVVVGLLMWVTRVLNGGAAGNNVNAAADHHCAKFACATDAENDIDDVDPAAGV